MLTKEQVMLLGEEFIYSLFTYSAMKLDLDWGRDKLVCGSCFYYATILSEILNEIDLNSISKIASFDSRHYFVHYNGNFFDGLGIIKQDNTNLRLWDYENETQYHYEVEEINKFFLYFQGNDPVKDASSGTTMNEPVKRAVWETFYLGYNKVKNELFEELRKVVPLGTEEIERVIKKYLKIAEKEIVDEKYFRKTDEGFEIGKVYELYLKTLNRTPEKEYECIERAKKTLEDIKQRKDEIDNPEEINYCWNPIINADKYICTEPTMITNIKAYVLRSKNKKEDN